MKYDETAGEKEVVLKGNLDEVIQQLIEFRDRKEKVFCVFSGHILHSRNVTVDSGYLEVTGYTKQEYYDELDKMQNVIENETEEINKRIPSYYERGKRLIDPDLLDEWERRVIKSCTGLNEGKDIEEALEIMELMSERKVAEAVKLFKDKKHSPSTYKAVLDLVTRFSYTGAIFWKAINSEKMEYMEAPPKRTLELTVNYLLKAKSMGEKVFTDFNGVILKSDSVTMDNAFMEVLGETKAEFDEKQADFKKNFAKEQLNRKKDALSRIPELVTRGERYIFPEKFDKWTDTVEKVCLGSFGPTIIVQVLEIMEALENGAKRDDLLEILRKQGHNGATAELVRDIVLEYSKKGPRFYKLTALAPMTHKEQEKIDLIADSNEKLVKKHIKEKVRSIKDRGDKPITEEIVINGLKLIAENPDMDQEQLASTLIEMGCDFTFEDVVRQFPSAGYLTEGIKDGHLGSGANVIVQARDSDFGRLFTEEKYLNDDNEYSIWHFIRLHTGDEDYTRDNIRGPKKSF